MKKLLPIIILMGLIESASAAVIGHTGKHWTVTEHDRSYKVGRDCIDGTLVNVNKYNMARFLQKGRIQATKMNDGQYMLRGHVNGLGGGPFGAMVGAWTGKFVVHLVAQTGLAVATAGVCCIGGPAAAGVFYLSAAATVASTTEAVSNVVAVGGTILGAVITGPA